ncbi:MAG: in-like serine protease [Cytophagaceae bacterium]|jgi:hypothetical protein|nr:in-like serine protease [Cytophagaceae bacterium]
MEKSKYLFTLFFFLGSSQLIWAQQQTYFVRFKDKASNSYSISNPEQFLTSRALERRQKCNVSIDEKDLPVSQTYIDQIKATGAEVLYPLKWFNGVVVRSDATVKNQVTALAFVSSADQSVKRVAAPSAAQEEFCFYATAKSLSDNSYLQNEMLGMIKMKEDGYDGNGVLIAITDDGFLHADTMTAFQHLFSNDKIIDAWDLVDLDKTVYSQGGGHGTHVFSILAGHLVNQFSGPGIGADFVLFRTEDTGSESPLEELNWVRAAEMADSLGSDIIQVSLGYNTFDNSSLDYNMSSDLDGHTSYSSQGASIAATRGIVVVVSAGNGGNSSWNKILCPGDAKGILTVGAVDVSENRASFSAIGYTSDGRLKPDVMAMGSSVAYVSSATGNVAYGNGTSFASPLIAGLSAGLMEAYPALTHHELIQAIQYSSDRFENPNPNYGYGIPNYERASDYARLLLDEENEGVFPNPIGSNVYVKIKKNQVGHPLHWELYTVKGELVDEGEKATESSVVNLFSTGESLKQGLYCLKISCNGHFSIYKVIK